MERRFVVAGIGGQGVVFATRLLAQVGLARGVPVTACENHGMSQRGGSVMSHVRLGGSDAPLIARGSADALVAFDRDEATRHLPFVRAGGTVYVNADRPLDASLAARLGELAIRVHAIDAHASALALGTAAVTNLVVLGFAGADPAFGIGARELEDAVRALGPAAAVARNLDALAMGARQAVAQ
jgi:indolepyruvate ferredoxin oxidoreductase beta subunit